MKACRQLHSILGVTTIIKKTTKKRWFSAHVKIIIVRIGNGHADVM